MGKVNIIFNGEKKTVDAREYSYEDIIYMSYSDRSVKPLAYPNVMSIVYDKGPKDNREGSMTHGDRIFPVEGMIINAMRTDNS